MRLKRESESYFNRGENRTHDLDDASYGHALASELRGQRIAHVNHVFKH